MPVKYPQKNLKLGNLLSPNTTSPMKYVYHGLSRFLNLLRGALPPRRCRNQNKAQKDRWEGYIPTSRSRGYYP